VIRSHPITRELANWWTTYGGRHDSPEWAAYLADMRSLLATKHDELTSEHHNEGRFGMSKAAGCTRAATLKALGAEPEPFDGDTLVTFHIGHMMECLAIATLRACGYNIDSSQERVRLDPFMSSAFDGVIEDIGVDLPGPLPALLSVKSAGYKGSSQSRGKWLRRGFAALPFDGIYKGNFSAWCQSQAEMHASGIPRTLVTVVAKDIVKAFQGDPYMQESGSLSFYCELVPVWSEAWGNVAAGKAGSAYFFNPTSGTYARLPKPGDTASGWGGPNQQATGTFSPCFGCDLVKACKADLARNYRSAA
jgi:hypothetical protein